TGLLHSTWIPAHPELSPPTVHYRRPRRPGPVPACTALTRSALDGLRPLTFLCSHNRRHDDTRQRGTDPAPPLEGRAPRRRRRGADQRGRSPIPGRLADREAVGRPLPRPLFHARPASAAEGLAE